MTSSPVVERLASGHDRATPEVSGPFETVQGGVLAGLAAVEIDGHAPPGFRVFSYRTEFLRPVPLGEPLDVSVGKVSKNAALLLLVRHTCLRQALCPQHHHTVVCSRN